MSCSGSNDSSLHAEALEALDQGRPRQALLAWREALTTNRAAVLAHLDAAAAHLEQDPIAPVRQQALHLAHALLAHDPNEAMVCDLGRLLKAWAAVCLPEVPSRALQHLERAWSCAADDEVKTTLAGLYARLGFHTGASLLGSAPATPEPWPVTPCAAQACWPCQQQQEQGSAEDQPNSSASIQLQTLANGRIWVQRHRNRWRISHGVAVTDGNDVFLPSYCRHYPWPWASCAHRPALQTLALEQLRQARADRPPLLRVHGPVLAVAELSGEMYFHWQLELLPRLGRCWHAALEHWPDLRLWHNGGDAPYVHEALARLGIPRERVVSAETGVAADLLVVPPFLSPFGQPSTDNLAWLEQFWAPDRTDCHHDTQPLWIGRGPTARRPALAETRWLQALHWPALQIARVEQQWQQVAAAPMLVAPHGAGLANLLAATTGIDLVELVNPAYHPPYFNSSIVRRRLHHRRLTAGATPSPLQEWLYEGPSLFPIDLRPGCSEAAEWLHSMGP